MKTCGIYNIVSKIDGKIYIGSSNDVNRRYYIHKRKLNKNAHDNPHLQLAWNKYGIDNFELRIVEPCDQNNLLLREQFYLDIAKNNENRYYNCNYISTKPPSPKGRIMSDLTKNKMSELMMGENNHRYGKKDSKETIERKTNSHVKTDHFFISPENTIVNIRNLRKFCDENNLNQGAMYGIYKGRINIHKGWRRYENHNN